MSMIKGRVFLKIVPSPPFIEIVESSTDMIYRTDLTSEVPYSNAKASLADAISKRVLEIENSKEIPSADSVPAISEETKVIIKLENDDLLAPPVLSDKDI